ncbi:unnamed protein product [Paramecium pentaurelia]|uniref:Uncharacterized protein n=1 Tax=Paramecium pentaurelia TaxID=43138 RepID=A0A8S1TEP0_9CILI|nr:unnamed protein product [Paramecium pentaurelia]
MCTFISECISTLDLVLIFKSYICYICNIIQFILCECSKLEINIIRQ